MVTGNHVWARTVIHQVASHVPDIQRIRALGFCVSVAHAHFMADQCPKAQIEAELVVPLLVHARYTRQEVLAALLQKADRAQTPPWREGVYWASDQRADVFMVTIDKIADHFSPHHPLPRLRDQPAVVPLGEQVDYVCRLPDRVSGTSTTRPAARMRGCNPWESPGS